MRIPIFPAHAARCINFMRGCGSMSCVYFRFCWWGGSVCAGNAVMGIIAMTRLTHKVCFYCDSHMNKTQFFYIVSSYGLAKFVHKVWLPWSASKSINPKHDMRWSNPTFLVGSLIISTLYCSWYKAIYLRQIWQLWAYVGLIKYICKPLSKLSWLPRAINKAKLTCENICFSCVAYFIGNLKMLSDLINKLKVCICLAESRDFQVVL